MAASDDLEIIRMAEEISDAIWERVDEIVDDEIVDDESRDFELIDTDMLNWLSDLTNDNLFERRKSNC